MLGLYIFSVLVMLFVHWGYVVPKFLSTLDKNDPYDLYDTKMALFIFGTMACLVPFVYFLIGSLIYVFIRGVKKYEKNNSDSK